MIIGFLGKGGSGKSTSATLMTKFLHGEGNLVLAIDADHNMDLMYNLKVATDKLKPIGGTFLDLRESFGAKIEDKTDVIFTEKLPQKRFSINPIDDYINQHTLEVGENLLCMMSGPQNENVLYGNHCSHSLAAPLKILLPLLELKENEYVVVDEKASVDAVSTGIPTGFDLAIICAEPKEHSIRVAKQIKELLDWYQIPYKTILNKCQLEEDVNFFKESFGEKPDFVLNFNSNSLELNDQNKKVFKEIKDVSKKLSVPNKSRLERTINKYKRNIDKK